MRRPDNETGAHATGSRPTSDRSQPVGPALLRRGANDWPASRSFSGHLRSCLRSATEVCGGGGPPRPPTHEEQLNRVALVLQWRDGSPASVSRLLPPKAAWTWSAPAQSCSAPVRDRLLVPCRPAAPYFPLPCACAPNILRALSPSPLRHPLRLLPLRPLLAGPLCPPSSQDVGLCVGLWWRHCAAGADGVCRMPRGGARCARGGSLDDGEEQGHPVSGGPARS